MLILHGAGVGKGIAIGKTFVLSGGKLDVPEYFIEAGDQQREVDRFKQALADACRQLESIAANIPPDAPTESASFIEAYLLMLQDPLIADQPVDTIRSRSINAERALQLHAASLIEAFDAMEDDYLRSKRTDVEHVVNRVQSNLLNIRHETLGMSPTTSAAGSSSPMTFRRRTPCCSRAAGSRLSPSTLADPYLTRPSWREA